MILEILQYTGIIILLVASLIGIAKDWQDSRRLRSMMILFIVLGGIISLISTYLAKKESQSEKDRLISAENTTRSVISEQNAKLLDKVIQLETRVLTEELQQELNRTREELERTQAALKPPKANLLFSIITEGERDFPTPEPRKEISLPVVNDTLVVKFVLKNVSDVYATDIRIWVQLCEYCEFLEEPERFKHLDLQARQVRHRTLKGLPEKTGLSPPIELKIKPPPPPIEGIGINFSVKCPECRPAEIQKFWINLTGRLQE